MVTLELQLQIRSAGGDTTQLSWWWWWWWWWSGDRLGGVIKHSSIVFLPICVFYHSGRQTVSALLLLLLNKHWSHILCYSWRYKQLHVFVPQHECFIDRVSQLEGVVTDGQVVLQSERLQHDAVSYRESQTQVVAGVTWKDKRRWLTGSFHPRNFWGTRKLSLCLRSEESRFLQSSSKLNLRDIKHHLLCNLIPVSQS